MTYFDKNKKCVEIVPLESNNQIIGYRVYMINKEMLGWQKLGDFKIIEVDGKKYIDERIMELINCLVDEGYCILSKKIVF